VTVRNLGTSQATGVVDHPASSPNHQLRLGGQRGSFGGRKVNGTNLEIPAGGSISVALHGEEYLAEPARLGDVHRQRRHRGSSRPGPGTTGSRTPWPIAPAPRGCPVTRAEQKGGAKVGQDVSYLVHVSNRRFQSDTYALSTSGQLGHVDL